MVCGCGQSGKKDGCEEGLTDCGGTCVDLETDPDNCGGCGVECNEAGGESCVDGTCFLDCGDLTNCDGECVDIEDDPENCGGCGIECDVGAGEACLEGTCVTDCGDLTNCGGRCVDLQTDPDHCGACGVECNEAAGEVCVDGACGCGDLTDCDGECVDLQTDLDHCGACGVECARSTRCVAGDCGQVGVTCGGDVCPSGAQCCWNAIDGEYCFDTDTEDCYGFILVCDGPEDCEEGEVCCHTETAEQIGECTTTCDSRIYCAEDEDCDPEGPDPVCCNEADFAFCSHNDIAPCD
jgi:hypothetical protein